MTDGGQTREERLLLDALRRGWLSADALVRWVAERSEADALLDDAVSRGVIDAERARRLRLESEDTSPRAAAGPRDGTDAPTRRQRLVEPGALDRLPPHEAATQVVEARGTTGARAVAVVPGFVSVAGDGDAEALPPPASLVTLPGELPFEPVGRMAQGRYELGQVIGRGGMGVVHVARDCTLGRRVALKMLRATGRPNPGYARALAREAQTTGQLDHPGIVPVYELRAEPDGTVFYTMKLATGVSLSEVIRRLRRGQADAVSEFRLVRRLQIFQQICMALHYAHTRGVIHRDLKPANILLGGYGEVLVVDWGIALAGVETGLREGTGIGEGLVARGQLVGTPRYMSPEQASGNMAALDARSDIYALGVILYELVTLVLPFEDLDTLTWLTRFRSEPLPAPTHDARGRRVPPDLVHVVQRATAVDRRDRHPDARALWEDVEAWIEGRQERDRRRQEATAAWLRGRRAAEQFHELSARRAALDEQVRALEGALDPWSPRERKETLQRLVVQRENLDLLLARTFSDATRELQRSVTDDPAAEGPRRALAHLLRERFRAAEQRRDMVAMTWFGELVEHVEQPEAEAGGPAPASGAPGEGPPPAASDAGAGRLHVRSFPEGAEICVVGVRDVEAAPEAPPERVIGRAPLADVRLAPGIHLLTARMDGYRDARYPVFVAPGSRQDVLLTLTPWTAAVPMVGREGELAQLRAMFESVVEHRRARACLVVGEPGSGRTRLQDAFGEYVEARPDVVIFAWVHCLSIHQGVPFHALAEVLRFRSGVRPGDPPDVVLARLREMTREAWRPSAADRAAPDAVADAAAVDSEADAAAAALATLPGFDGPPADGLSGAALRQRVEAALAEYLARLGRHFPIALIFKEMQWIDGASRRFLEAFLARHQAPTLDPAAPAGAPGRVPLFVLGSTTQAAEESHLQGRRLLEDHPRVPLPPLGRTAAGQLVTTLLKGRAHEELAALVNDRARGNPYLVEELAHHLRAEGWIANEAGEWYLVRSATGRRAADLPHVDVSSFIARRARALPEAERAALLAAAVVGRVFWAEALAALGIPDPAPVLRGLARRDLIQAVPHARFAGTTEFTFRLETLWRVAYADVPEPRRRVLHGRTAAWLRALAPVTGGRSFEQRALLALHADRSGDPQGAAHVRASLARDAASLAAWDEAVYHWDRALSHPLAPAERAAWRAERAAALAYRDR